MNDPRMMEPSRVTHYHQPTTANINSTSETPTTTKFNYKENKTEVGNYTIRVTPKDLEHTLVENSIAEELVLFRGSIDFFGS